MKQLIAEPEGWPCKLSECPPGSFLCHDEVCLKSEYGKKNQDGSYSVEAFCDSGEFFCGGDDCIVQPIVFKWVDRDDLYGNS